MDKNIAEEMTEALKTVWQICGKTETCKGCPALGEDGVCRQYDSAPYSWKTGKERRSRWKTRKTWREDFWEKQEAKHGEV